MKEDSDKKQKNTADKNSESGGKTHDKEKKNEEKESGEEHEEGDYGGMPDRNFRKNLGCGG